MRRYQSAVELDAEDATAPARVQRRVQFPVSISMPELPMKHAIKPSPLGAIPKGKTAPQPVQPTDAAPPPAQLIAPKITISPAVSTEIVNRMLEAVTLQANAICEIHAHTPGPVGKAARIRAQGGWEVVRITLCVLGNDCAPERRALATHVWPELRARCAARRLHLLVVDPREGRSPDSLPPATCLLQLEQNARCNEGAPFALCIQGQSDGWIPPADVIASLGDSWVHGLSLGAWPLFSFLLPSPAMCLFAPALPRADGTGQALVGSGLTLPSHPIPSFPSPFMRPYLSPLRSYASQGKWKSSRRCVA